MHKVGIPKHEIRKIANLYYKQMAKIKCNSGMTDNIIISKGVRQGCILSPILFNLYSEMLMKEALDVDDDIKINGEMITTIRYADDTAVIAPSQEILQRMMNKIFMACKNYGMKLNVKKQK